MFNLIFVVIIVRDLRKKVLNNEYGKLNNTFQNVEYVIFVLNNTIKKIFTVISH